MEKGKIGSQSALPPQAVHMAYAHAQKDAIQPQNSIKLNQALKRILLRRLATQYGKWEVAHGMVKGLLHAPKGLLNPHIMEASGIGQQLGGKDQSVLLLMLQMLHGDTTCLHKHQATAV